MFFSQGKPHEHPLVLPEVYMEAKHAENSAQGDFMGFWSMNP